VRDLGGLTAVAASHPHLTGASIQWSHAFGNVPVLVAAADRAWIRRPDSVIELWARVRQVLPGVTLIQCGGHFAGSAVARWAPGAGGGGALLTGDTIAIGADRASVNVMRSCRPRPGLAGAAPLPARHGNAGRWHQAVRRSHPRGHRSHCGTTRPARNPPPPHRAADHAAAPTRTTCSRRSGITANTSTARTTAHDGLTFASGVGLGTAGSLRCRRVSGRQIASVSSTPETKSSRRVRAVSRTASASA